jgi:hypothetical protein
MTYTLADRPPDAQNVGALPADADLYSARVSHMVSGPPSWYSGLHATADEYQIPFVPTARFDSLPADWTAYSRHSQVKRPWLTGLHGNLKDCRLRPLLNHPEVWLERVAPFWGINGPDFTIRDDEPDDARIFAVRMTRAVEAYFASRGIRVIPNVRWWDRDDFRFCLLGLEHGCPIAISNHAIWRNPYQRQKFAAGLAHLAGIHQPQMVFFHGNPNHPEIRHALGSTPVVVIIPDRTQARQRRCS